MVTTPKPPTSPTLDIPQGLDTVYCNLARISHSPADIVIDFALALPGEPKAMVQTRVVMSPLSAYTTEARGKLSVQRALTLVSAGYAAGTIFSPAGFPAFSANRVNRKGFALRLNLPETRSARMRLLSARLKLWANESRPAACHSARHSAKASAGS